MRLDGNELSGSGTRLSTRYDVNRVAIYDGKPSRWWLRSPGILPGFVASVWADGAVNVGGESFVSTTGYRLQGVRPALWLYLCQNMENAPKFSFLNDVKQNVDKRF